MSLLLRLLPQSGRIPPRVKLISPQSGRTQPESNLQVHKVDGSHQGSTRFTKWTDPTRIKLISPQCGRIPPRVNTVHKVDGPNQGQTYTSPKSGRTQPRSNLYKSKKWTDPTRVKLIQLQKRGRTLPTFKTPIHIMDGPNQFIKLYKSTKWTAIRGHDHIPRNGQTRPGSQTL